MKRRFSTMSVSNFTSATFSVVEKYTQIMCIFVSKIRQRKSTLKFACKKSACKSLCKNSHASLLRGFFVEIRHIARNLRASKCCNARGLYCMVVPVHKNQARKTQLIIDPYVPLLQGDVLSNFKKHLSNHYILSHLQHGFCTNLSCETQLSLTFHE